MVKDQHTTLCFPFSGDSVGGSHVSVLGLLRMLDRSRFRVLVVPEIPDGAIAKLFNAFECLADPSPAVRPFKPGKRFGAAKFARTLTGIVPRLRFLQQHGVDIVHTNDGRTHASWATAARLAGVRLVWHHRGAPGAIGLRLLAPIVADRVVTVSSFALPRRGIWSAAAKAEVVHSPFDTRISVDRAEARRRLADELGIDESTLILGFLGSFVRRKRPLLFVDAVERVRELVPRPVLGVMFGEAKDPVIDRALSSRLRNPSGNPPVRVMGYRTPGAYWIAACDQLLVPSVGEPFGRTLVEAMLVGTPVVAARSGGNIEALEGGLGALVHPDDVEAIAGACAQLAMDSARARVMSLRAQQDARQRFGDARHCARLSEIYDSLCGTPQPGRFGERPHEAAS